MQHDLKFNSEGRFRILMVSDIQEKADYDPRTPVCYRKLVEETSPDLIVWGGDNIDGRVCKTAEELKNHLDVFAAPAEDAGIPWTFVFGNHDYDMDVTPAEQALIYDSYPHCVSKRATGIHGVSNSALTISDASGKPAFAVYCFDTAHKFPELREGVKTEDLLIENIPSTVKKWDIIRFDQLMWYWNTSLAIEEDAGRTVPALAVMHVPPYELDYVHLSPDACKAAGDDTQKLQMGVLNSGVYATMLQRGDVRAIAAGHLHKSTIEGEFGGITLCLDGCAGFSPSSYDCCRGGRVFDVDLAGNISTRFIPYQSITSIELPE